MGRKRSRQETTEEDSSSSDEEKSSSSSSSSSESSSSSSSSSSQTRSNKRIVKKKNHRKPSGTLNRVDNDEESSSSSDSSEIDQDIIDSTTMMGRTVPIMSMDDLPSDDSVSLDSSSSEEDDDDDDDKNNKTMKLSYQEQHEHNHTLSIEERLAKKREKKNAPSRSLRDEKRKRGQVAIATVKKLLSRTRAKRQQQQRQGSSSSPAKMSLTKDDDDVIVVDSTTTTTQKKKRSKHAPTEVSSKRKDFFQRGAPSLFDSGVDGGISSQRKYRPQDPRQVSLSGHLNQDSFHTNYAFIQELRKKEMDQLKRNISIRQRSGRKGQRLRKQYGLMQSPSSLKEDQDRLAQLTQEYKQTERLKLDRAATVTVKRQLKEKVASGEQGAYYLKKREMKKRVAEAKYDLLASRGDDDKNSKEAVKKALIKRRSKNKSRDSKRMRKFY